jgi:hypothetical protein
MEAQKQLVVRSVLDAWYSRLESADKLFGSLTDGQLQQEIAPGRNRGVYLLGHLTAVHDKMLPLLDFEPQVFAHLEEPFLNNADKTVADIPTVTELRNSWNDVNSRLASHFKKLSPDEWFHKHASVSQEDFAKEPHRNRLNVLVGRTNHMQYHMGQVALLKK